MAFKMRGFSGFKQKDEKKNVKVVPGSTYGDDDAMHFKGIDAKGDTATYETFGYDAEIDMAKDSIGVQGPRVDVQALEDSMLSPAEKEAEKAERARMAKAKAEREKKSPAKQKVKEENRTGDYTRKEPMYAPNEPRAQEIRPQPRQQFYKDTEEGIKEAKAKKAAEKAHKERIEYLSDSRNMVGYGGASPAKQTKSKDDGLPANFYKMVESKSKNKAGGSINVGQTKVATRKNNGKFTGVYFKV